MNSSLAAFLDDLLINKPREDIYSQSYPQVGHATCT